MELKTKGFLIDNIIWHSISIFYSQSNSAVLLKTIADFCETHQNQIEHGSFYFSRMNGQCVNFVFVLREQDTAVSFLDFVEDYFTRFLNENPSSNPAVEPIPLVNKDNTQIAHSNQRVYDNNILVWNAFYIPFFLSDGRDAREFARITSLLIASLYDADSSLDENAMSIAVFLRVKLLKRRNMPFPNISDSSVAETVRSYWEYEEDDLLATWLHHTDDVSASVIVRCHLDYWTPDPTGLGV
jgi:hypothetical protein